jgi:hypothetical protein
MIFWFFGGAEESQELEIATGTNDKLIPYRLRFLET